ncbi:MAG: hypothetical protein HYY68_07725 [Thaumarchaeota archaeon]|nr:hypothetical protein [Nitrososphaerota archaeon]
MKEPTNRFERLLEELRKLSPQERQERAREAARVYAQLARDRSKARLPRASGN